MRRDLGHAIRVAAKRPGFSLAVVLILALGIGANTAVFSLLNTVVLCPLPYLDAHRLYTLFEQDSLSASRQLASYPTFLDWHEQSDVFDGLAYIRGSGLVVSGRAHRPRDVRHRGRAAHGCRRRRRLAARAPRGVGRSHDCAAVRLAQVALPQDLHVMALVPRDDPQRGR